MIASQQTHVGIREGDAVIHRILKAENIKCCQAEGRELIRHVSAS